MIIWLIGISGAGKTTLGKMLECHFLKKGINCCLLDGDEIRNFFDNDLGYSISDREANIKRIIFGAYLLEKNDIVGIVCNISPFQYLREFARRKIPGYNEIYLEKDIKISIKNDVKEMYRNNIGKTEIIGMGQRFDEPTSCDIRILVDTMSEKESFDMIVDYIRNKYGENFG